jgi:hypothetical protein
VSVAQEAKKTPTVSVAEVLASMSHNADQRDEDAAELTSPESRSSTRSPLDSADNDLTDDDESIDDYMGRLMLRMRGEAMKQEPESLAAEEDAADEADLDPAQDLDLSPDTADPAGSPLPQCETAPTPETLEQPDRDATPEPANESTDDGIAFEVRARHWLGMAVCLGCALFFFAAACGLFIAAVVMTSFLLCFGCITSMTAFCISYSLYRRSRVAYRQVLAGIPAPSESPVTTDDSADANKGEVEADTGVGDDRSPEAAESDQEELLLFSADGGGEAGDGHATVADQCLTGDQVRTTDDPEDGARHILGQTDATEW